MVRKHVLLFSLFSKYVEKMVTWTWLCTVLLDIWWNMLECCANMLNKYLALRFYVMFFKVISPFSDQVFSNRLTIFARSSILDVWQVSWFCSLFGNNFPFSQQLCHFISWVFDNIYFSFPYLFQESMVLFQLRLTYLHYFELSLTVI